MLVLLTGVDTGPPRVAASDVENKVRCKGMRPCAAVVVTFRTAARGPEIADRIKDRYLLQRKSEEGTVLFAELMVHANLIAVGLVGRRTALRKIVLRVAGKIWRGRISSEKLLHGAEDQGLRDLEARSTGRLTLLVLGIDGQRNSGGVAAEFIPDKAARSGSRSGRVRIENSTAERCVGEIAVY